MKCVNHPERLAEYTCAGCGKPFCSECIEIINNEPFCKECAQERTRKEVEKKNIIFCSQCGKLITQGALTCPFCGAKVIIEVPKRNGLAIASLVCGIFGLWLFALLFGAFALTRGPKKEGELIGKKIAIAGLILGSLWALMILIVALSSF